MFVASGRGNWSPVQKLDNAITLKVSTILQRCTCQYWIFSGHVISFQETKNGAVYNYYATKTTGALSINCEVFALVPSGVLLRLISNTYVKQVTLFFHPAPEIIFFQPLQNCTPFRKLKGLSARYISSKTATMDIVRELVFITSSPSVILSSAMHCTGGGRVKKFGPEKEVLGDAAVVYAGDGKRWW